MSSYLLNNKKSQQQQQQPRITYARSAAHVPWSGGGGSGAQKPSSLTTSSGIIAARSVANLPWSMENATVIKTGGILLRSGLNAKLPELVFPISVEDREKIVALFQEVLFYEFELQEYGIKQAQRFWDDLHEELVELIKSDRVRESVKSLFRETAVKFVINWYVRNINQQTGDGPQRLVAAKIVKLYLATFVVHDDTGELPKGKFLDAGKENIILWLEQERDSSKENFKKVRINLFINEVKEWSLTEINPRTQIIDSRSVAHLTWSGVEDVGGVMKTGEHWTEEKLKAEFKKIRGTNPDAAKKILIAKVGGNANLIKIINRFSSNFHENSGILSARSVANIPWNMNDGVNVMETGENKTALDKALDELRAAAAYDMGDRDTGEIYKQTLKKAEAAVEREFNNEKKNNGGSAPNAKKVLIKKVGESSPLALFIKSLPSNSSALSAFQLGVLNGENMHAVIKTGCKPGVQSAVRELLAGHETLLSDLNVLSDEKRKACLEKLKELALNQVKLHFRAERDEKRNKAGPPFDFEKTKEEILEWISEEKGKFMILFEKREKDAPPKNDSGRLRGEPFSAKILIRDVANSLFTKVSFLKEKDIEICEQSFLFGSQLAPRAELFVRTVDAERGFHEVLLQPAGVREALPAFRYSSKLRQLHPVAGSSELHTASALHACQQYFAEAGLLEPKE